ncbi:hypothetical protein [Paenarthrobacter ilicis]|uniref:Uncharacterized protein n=1 Tax=Paenarthrobacter ilicis TaxID=43665 RepID=A0ABX0TCZ0_9MICC|nr:hypothetical protein [Paenarthrobacter ilicis]MBM7794177.1 hypothetical protein [Paenarthrobacter ilicis]NIJ00357.1 hypothetical protein [Paenarthrobacter ilicis]
MQPVENDALAPSFLSNDYQPWPGGHFEWPSLIDFLNQESWDDGVHTIPIGAGPNLDLFFSGSPLDAETAVVPVFFNGAVSDRESKVGPFFSGRKLAAAAGIGFIAVSDPSHNLDPSLGLAWYAGNKLQDLQNSLDAILRGIASRAERELLFIGGSGGGFASLYYGNRLSQKASVLVWNPQTSITEYNETFAKNYFTRALGVGDELHGVDWKSVAKSKASTRGIQTEVLISRPRRLLYMQNGSDWHTPVHAVPFLRGGHFEHAGNGIFATDDNHQVWIANYGDGHAPLPENILLVALQLMIDADMSVSDVVNRMVESCSDGTTALGKSWLRIGDVLPDGTELHDLA